MATGARPATVLIHLLARVSSEMARFWNCSVVSLRVLVIARWRHVCDSMSLPALASVTTMSRVM